MKDRYLIAIIVAVFAAWILFLHFALGGRAPLHYVGLPVGATCTRDAQIRTCVVSGTEYRCVVDWSKRTAQCAQTWRQRL